MKNQVELIDPKQFGLEEKQANNITKGLSTILEERELLTESYKDVMLLEITQENLKTFKELRLQIVKNRTQGLKVWHKTNKEYFLSGGNFVQAIYNKEVAENERMESSLMEAEKHFENLEKKRLEDLQSERVNLLSEYVEDASERDLSSMEQDVWEAYLSTKKQNYIDRLEAEKKAEQERQAKIKAEQEEQERIRKENEELKKAAELKSKQDEAERLEREKLAKIEQDKRDKIEAKRLAKEKKERLEREEVARVEKEEQQAKINAEKAKADKLTKELADKKAEDERIEAKRLADQQAELNKGDSAKVKDLISDLESLKSKYQFKSTKNQKMYQDINILIDKVTSFIKNK